MEDTSENYIEKPFLDPSTFMAFMKQAVDVVQCRMKPAYMEPDSVVRPPALHTLHIKHPWQALVELHWVTPAAWLQVSNIIGGVMGC